jgi:hypothetical protein
MADKINPDHYKAGKGLEVIDIIELFDLNFSRGNSIKYILRAGRKDEQGYTNIDKEIEDLKKAVWYTNREIENLIAKRDSYANVVSTSKDNVS